MFLGILNTAVIYLCSIILEPDFMQEKMLLNYTLNRKVYFQLIGQNLCRSGGTVEIKIKLNVSKLIVTLTFFKAFDSINHSLRY